MQGPTELLPVSSSGHLALLGSRDRTFEVYLHAGTAAALLVALRGEVAGAVAELDRERLARVVFTLAPAGVAGWALEGRGEPRGLVRVVAAAQVLGGLALIVSDRAPADRAGSDATARDALLIGLAQACALVPGVSRNGATLTAARLLGFRREAASRMSRHAALPVIAGATGLKLLHSRRMSPTSLQIVGFATAFGSSLAAARLVGRVDRLRSYAPFGAYRIALGLAVLRAGGRTAGPWA